MPDSPKHKKPTRSEETEIFLSLLLEGTSHPESTQALIDKLESRFSVNEASPPHTLFPKGPNPQKNLFQTQELNLLHLVSEGYSFEEIRSALGVSIEELHHQMLSILKRHHRGHLPFKLTPEQVEFGVEQELLTFTDEAYPGKIFQLSLKQLSDTEKKRGFERLQNFKNSLLKDLIPVLIASKKKSDQNEHATKTMSEEKGTAVLKPSLRPGEIIKKDLIDGLGLTVNDAANKTGIDRKYLYQIITGDRALSKNVAIKLSALFDECREKTGKRYTVKGLLGLQLEEELKHLDIPPHLIE